jgi:Zn-dependent M28 family amino/carboxypeptidase
MLRLITVIPLFVAATVCADTPLMADLNALKLQPHDVTVEKTNQWRQAKAIELFKQAGATKIAEQNVTTDGAQGAPLPVKNVIVELPGTTKDTIVLGAHLDKHYNGQGDGAVDDWSGVVTMVDLYRQLSKRPNRKFTYVFVAFAYEEDGLWGSRSYVNALSPDTLARIKGMINLECLGVSHLHIWQNGSTDALIDFAVELAKKNKIKLISRDLPKGVVSDSIPFSEKGIPSITFDSLKPDDFPLIHSKDDTLEKISPNNFNDGHAFIVKYLVEIDENGVPIGPDWFQW